MEKISSEKISTFLNGRDPMEHIISIECDYNDENVCIIYVAPDGVKRIRREPFNPFVWVRSDAVSKMCGGKTGELRKLMQSFGIVAKKLKTGDSGIDRLEKGYNLIFYSKKPMSFQRFQQFFNKVKVPIYPKFDKDGDIKKRPEKYILSVSPVEQYMIASGKRLFKGYENYNDLKRMSFDLETEGLNAEIHCIEQIGIRTNKGLETVLSVTGKGDEKFKNEMDAICEFFSIASKEKPDILFGHNSENFDWDFLEVRCRKHGVTMEDVSLAYFKRPIYKKKKESVLKLGGEVEYYHPTVIWGHSVVDSLHAVRRAQALDSDMESASLKYVTKYLGLKKRNRVYVPGDQISTIWNDLSESYAFNDENGDWYKVSEEKPLQGGYTLKSGKYIVERYLLDDLWETDNVELKLNESNFLVGKMLPTTFQKTCTMGTAGIWKLLMLAWCYENDLAVPAFDKPRRFTGGLSRLLKTGYVPRIVKLDYNSLYPSIILTWFIITMLDISGVMQGLLEYILTQREKYKELKGDAGARAKEFKTKLTAFVGNSDERAELEDLIQYWESIKSANDKLQLPLKILANSFFGSFGAPHIFPFGDTMAAEKTTCIGRMSLRLMISHFTKLGYTPIVGDSVTYDTPIFMKDKKGRIDILPICDMFNEKSAIEFENEQYRDFSNKPYKVLTRNGWKDIKYVYKHKTDKQIRRIETKNGLVDCTEDHSLFGEDGTEITPASLQRGDKIELYEEPLKYAKCEELTPDKAWLFGFFLSDGSATYGDRIQKYFSKRKNEVVIHKGKRAAWKISNQSLERLNKAKKILEDEFKLKCSIKNHMKSSNVYNLIVENARTAESFADDFYTSYRYKKVPKSILNSDKDCKKAFLDGFCCGDGQGDTIDECIEFGQKSKVAMAGLYFILNELGYNFRFHNRNDKPEFISFRLRNRHFSLLNEKYSKRRKNEVWRNVPVTSKSDFVYDISADGTFVDALGMIVCHNTDGFNFQIPNELRYTDEHPYISNGKGRNSVEGKAYTGIDADVAEFEDLYFNAPWNGGVNKMGLGVDEYCDATINFSRKNYADLLPDGKIKKVGNTIKSRKMSGYLKRFLDDGISLLLHGDGQQFLENYYNYIDDIYNYRIPIKEIASKGKIKKSLEDYKKDCNTLTKSGQKKSRQAWYELAIQNGLRPNISDTIYYINTGTQTSHGDVKRIKTQYMKDPEGNVVEAKGKVKTDKIKELCLEQNLDYKSLTAKQKTELIKPYIINETEEIILNCKLVPQEIVDSERDILCSEVEGMEYNVAKYIKQFNARIKTLLVCFSPEIRNDILITNPDNRKSFTKKQSELVSGFPNNEGDQDTYEALMTPERKEIEFWLKDGERPPFIEECGIDWEELVKNHLKTLEEEESALFQEENKKYLEALESITEDDVDALEQEGVVPKVFADIVTLDDNMYFHFIKLPNMTPSTGGYLFEDVCHIDTSEEKYEIGVEAVQ